MRLSKAILFLALFTLPILTLPGVAMAQPTPVMPIMAPGNTVLTVSAEGKSLRKPDLAEFSAGVASTGKTAGEALAANSANMTKVIAALKRTGIADKDIQTSNLSLNPVYGDMTRLPGNGLEQQMPRIVGYQVSNQVSVKQRNIAEYGRVIDTLVAAGANQVNGPNFMMDRPDEALDEARIDAVKKARARAALYATAAGLKVVRILAINEGGSFAPQPPMMYAKAMAMDASGGSTPVSAGEIAMQSGVTITFELAP